MSHKLPVSRVQKLMKLAIAEEAEFQNKHSHIGNLK